jgi:GMP synthase (glutamine-hydrolysing)
VTRLQNIHSQKILILDFGAQYTQLIGRRVREAGVYCEIVPWDVDDNTIRDFDAKGIILSGGPESVTVTPSPRAPAIVFNLNIPVLGICYGMQTMAEQLGGKVESSNLREFGYAQVALQGRSALFRDIADHESDGKTFIDVWMSHGDKVMKLPPGFEINGSTPSCPIAAMSCAEKNLYAVQFHPEVTHTLQGERMLSRFVRDICQCDGLWTPASIIEDAIHAVRKQVGKDKVLLGLSAQE